MQKFVNHSGTAAPLDIINIDTDMIIPKQFLKTIKRTGLGANLFDEMRFDTDGSEKPDFILNREPWRGASILVAGDNFGCGSSREHAPWHGHLRPPTGPWQWRRRRADPQSGCWCRNR